jgi:hypothetical protein
MKRTLLLGSAWTASAAAAVGLGFLAISLVDASASPGGQPVPASSTSTDSSEGAAPAPSERTGSPAPAADGQHVTDGGTVYASCTDGAPVLASAPAAGWRLDDSNDAGKVEFENGALEIEVRVTCVDGVPQFSVEGPGSNDGSGNDRASTAPVPSAATGDDSAGRVGGGQGSDDAPGDDSDDRSGGGHGSDD